MEQNLKYQQYAKLGPFEIKDFLAKVATKSAQDQSLTYLNAGRGNPNWVATEPREGFFLLGQFVVLESKGVRPAAGAAACRRAGAAARLEAWLGCTRTCPAHHSCSAWCPA
jgi:aspartate 4-decarboxylase